MLFVYGALAGAGTLALLQNWFDFRIDTAIFRLLRRAKKTRDSVVSDVRHF